MSQSSRRPLLALGAAIALAIIAAAALTLAGRGEARSASAPAAVPASAGDWGLSFQNEGQPPVGNASREELSQYNAYYLGNSAEKVIYLTFDCGYRPTPDKSRT